MSLIFLLMVSAFQATAPVMPEVTPEVTPAPGPTAAASPEGGEGRVELECTVQEDGRLSACVIRSETPRDRGFGAAAVSAARRARLSAGTVAGVATGGKVRFTTRFRIAD
jgi:TonB family protein